MTAAHWLNYSHSDQALLRDPSLDGCWQGLVVPGTLATYYFEGTGGFVLARQRPYVIDPRTPLIQPVEVRRPPPKASHLTLLDVHDPAAELSAVWPAREIPLEYWQQTGVWPRAVDRVLEFQERYARSAAGKLDKYTRLLAEARGHEVTEHPAPIGPARFVPPYWSATGPADAWWDLTRAAVEYAVRRYGDGGLVMPIVAVRNELPIATFRPLIQSLPAGVEQVFCWRGSWDEARASDQDVEGWVETLESASARGIAVTNLYGGYLSVLLTSLGLDGVSHGVGYSESRDVRRLGETGAPPTRYYIPALHAFETVPNAQPIVDHLPSEWSCGCPECERVRADGRPVVAALSPEQRKRHFLHARQAEFGLVATDVASALDRLEEVANWLEAHPLPVAVSPAHAERLRRWAGSIRRHT